MTFGESLYLALVLAGFVTFSLTLAIASWRTERFLRGKAAAEAPDAQDRLTQKAA